MKAEFGGEKIVEAVRKLTGAEVVIEETDGARDVKDLIFQRADFSEGTSFLTLDDINVNAFCELESEHSTLYATVLVMEK